MDVLLISLAVAMPLSIAVTNILLLLLVLFWIRDQTAQGWPVVRSPDRLTVFFVLFLGASILSSLLSVAPGKSLQNLRADFYFLMIPMLASFVRDRPDRTERILDAFLWASAASAAFGILQYVIGVNRFDTHAQGFLYVPGPLKHWPAWILNPLGMLDGRMVSTRSHPLTLGEGLLLGLTWAAGRWVGKDPQPVKTGLAAALLLMAILLNQSRGVWLSCGVLSVALLWFSPPAARKWLLALLVLPATMLVLTPSLRDRAFSILDQQHVSNTARFAMWKAGAAMIRDYPIVGVGAGNVKRISGHYRSDETVQNRWGHLHSTVLNLTVERGLLGLIAFAALFGWMVVRLWRTYWLSAPGSVQAGIACMGILAWLGFFLSGLTETVYNDDEILIIFFFLIGLALAHAPDRPPRPS